MSGHKSIAKLFIDFHTVVVRDKIDPQAAHQAFLVVDEYRSMISPDIESATLEEIMAEVAARMELPARMRAQTSD